MENAFSANVVAALEERGHTIVREPHDTVFSFGGAQLVHVLHDGYVAGSDHRKDGIAIGF